jgi:hypothetical protein
VIGWQCAFVAFSATLGFDPAGNGLWPSQQPGECITRVPM